MGAGINKQVKRENEVLKSNERELEAIITGLKLDNKDALKVNGALQNENKRLIEKLVKFKNRNLFERIFRKYEK